MKKKVLVLLADGFEEIETITCIDLLRRAALDVKAVSITGEVLIKGSRDITVETDIKISDIEELPDAIVLPGGAEGAENLAKSKEVIDLIEKCFDEKKIIAAICAAPAVVLSKSKVLDNKKATCYPGLEEKFKDKTTYIDKGVVVDDNVITSQGPGTAAYFALEIIRQLRGENVTDAVRKKALVE